MMASRWVRPSTKRFSLTIRDTVGIQNLEVKQHFCDPTVCLLQAIGAKSIDLEWVQVHPTGLVKPDDADAKIKFLAAEAERKSTIQFCL